MDNLKRSQCNFFLYMLSDQGPLGMTSSRSNAIGQESTSCEKIHDIAVATMEKRFSWLPGESTSKIEGVPANTHVFSRPPRRLNLRGGGQI